MTPVTIETIPACGAAWRSKAYALTDDENGRFREAAAGYEAVLLSTPTDIETIINLAVLYWQASGGGFPTSVTLSTEFSSQARARLRELFDSVAPSLADRAEIRFWKRYIAAAQAGMPLEPGECRRLMRERPDYLEPAFVLFSRSAGREAEPEAMRLLADYAEQPTARARYVTSAINAALRRQRWNHSAFATG